MGDEFRRSTYKKRATKWKLLASWIQVKHFTTMGMCIRYLQIRLKIIENLFSILPLWGLKIVFFANISIFKTDVRGHICFILPSRLWVLDCPMATSVLLRMLDYLRRGFNKWMPIKVQDDLQQQAGAVQRCVCWGGGTVWFGAKCFEMLSFCHRIISDPNQSTSDISSDVLSEIILNPVPSDNVYFLDWCWLPEFHKDKCTCK